MTAPVLQGCPQKGHNRLPGQQAGGWKPRPCPECGKLFEPKVRNQLFCSTAHRIAWDNRATARGRVLTPIAFVARITRNGTRGTEEHRKTGKQAGHEQHILIQRWRDEDRAAGRMEWPEYMTLRQRAGFDPL